MMRFYIFAVWFGMSKRVFGVSAERFGTAYRMLETHLKDTPHDAMILTCSLKTPETFTEIVDLSTTEKDEE